jgi:hypothetical protein
VHDSDEDWGDYTDSFCFLHGTETAVRPPASVSRRLACLEEELEDGTCEKILHPHYMSVQRSAAQCSAVQRSAVQCSAV